MKQQIRPRGMKISRGRKNFSHGSYRAKRKPNSPLLKKYTPAG